MELLGLLAEEVVVSLGQPLQGVGAVDLRVAFRVWVHLETDVVVADRTEMDRKACTVWLWVQALA